MRKTSVCLKKNMSVYSVYVYKLICVYQTKIDSDAFNISTLSQFILYSLENVNKIFQELRVKLCQNRLIWIMSDNFERNLVE